MTRALARAPRLADRTQAHTALRKLVCEYLAVQGIWFFCVRGGLGQRSSLPDIFACGRKSRMEPGILVAIELKTGRAKQTTKQAREMEALRQAGALCVVARSVDDVEAACVAAGLCSPALV